MLKGLEDEEKRTYSQELNDGAVDLIWPGAGIERSHETGQDPIAELGFWDWFFVLLVLEELEDLNF